MRFWEHVEELRGTLVRCALIIFLSTLAAFCFHKQLIALLLIPLGNHPLYFFGPTEGFTLALKVSFWTGLLASSPLWLYTILHFILPGLRKREKKLILPFFCLSITFIALGLTLAYTLTLPLVIRFFTQFNAGLGDNLWGLAQTLHFALMLILGHGLIFELYVGLLLLINYGFVSVHQLKRGRRVVMIVILVIAAIVTPPDILSQLLLAMPMLLLYEGAILYARTRAPSN